MCKTLIQSTLFLIFLTLTKVVVACECEGVGFWQTAIRANSIVIAKVTDDETSEHSAGKVEILTELVGNLEKSTINFGHTECSENLGRYSVGDSLLLVPSFDKYHQRWVLETCEASILLIKKGLVSGQFNNPSITYGFQHIPLAKVVELIGEYRKSSSTINYKLLTPYVRNLEILSQYPITLAKKLDIKGYHFSPGFIPMSASGLGGSEWLEFTNRGSRDTLIAKVGYRSSYREIKIKKRLFRKPKYTSVRKTETGYLESDTFVHWGNNYYQCVGKSSLYNGNPFFVFTDNFMSRNNNLPLTPGTSVTLVWHGAETELLIGQISHPYTMSDSVVVSYTLTEKSGKQIDSVYHLTLKKARVDTNTISHNRVSYLGTYKTKPPYKKTYDTITQGLSYTPELDIAFFSDHYNYNQSDLDFGDYHHMGGFYNYLEKKGKLKEED